MLDVCEKCGGTWLDSTEFDKVENANKKKVGLFGLFFNFLHKKGR
jgi:Zn-finger nucleic acid-binding protein